MLPLETFVTFAFACIFSVGLLATWLRFVSKPSQGRRA